KRLNIDPDLENRRAFFAFFKDFYYPLWGIRQRPCRGGLRPGVATTVNLFVRPFDLSGSNPCAHHCQYHLNQCGIKAFTALRQPNSATPLMNYDFASRTLPSTL